MVKLLANIIIGTNMINTIKRICESKDVKVYKRLLAVLGGYSTNFPATGVSGLFDTVVDQGKKILPNDKQALSIIDFVLQDASEPAAVQKLLNMRFSDVPTEYRPVTKNGNKHEVAFWVRNGVISDRVKDLIDFSNVGKQGGWCDVDGEKVTLIDLTKECE